MSDVKTAVSAPDSNHFGHACPTLLSIKINYGVLFTTKVYAHNMQMTHRTFATVFFVFESLYARWKTTLAR